MTQVEPTIVRFVQDLALDTVGIYDLDVASLAIRKL
jgi:hypothetical protein